MMQDPKALLDSLMGNDRNAGKKDGKRQAFQDAWKNEDICKNYLVWECPHDFFLNEEGKPCPRSPFPECPKQHSEAMKLRFQKDKDYDSYRYRYLQDLERKLRRLIDGVNVKRDMEREKLEKGESSAQRFAKSHIEEQEGIVKNKLLAAEELGASGALEESQAALDEAKTKQSKLEEKKGITEAKLDKICDVCGTPICWADAGSKGYGTAHGHFLGALHMGWAEMRECLAKVQEEIKQAPAPSERDPSDKGDKEDNLRSKDKHRSPSRQHKRRGGDGRRSPVLDKAKREPVDRARTSYSDRGHAERHDERRRENDTGKDQGERRSRDGHLKERTRSRGEARGRDREATRPKRNDRRDRSIKKCFDEFGRDTRIARHVSDDVRSIYVDFSEDWEKVMGEKFEASRLAMNEWEMTAFDGKGELLDLNSPQVSLTIESFPLQFKFTKKNTPAPSADRSRSRSRTGPRS